MKAIWKDDYYAFSNIEKLSYYISDINGNKLYSGKAYAFPGGDTPEGRINLSRICSNYLLNELPDLSTITGTTTYVHSAATGTFKVYDNTDTLLTTEDYVWDWSYDDNVSYSGTTLMSRPVNGHYVPNQLVFSTQYTGGQVRTTITLPGGDYCGRYALIYLNSYGGWDSFLIEGKGIEKNSYERKTYDTDIDNNYRQSKRQTNIYGNSLVREWELHTGWLSDSEARVVSSQLFSSNNVYLQDLDTMLFYPVSISNTDTTFKEFRWERKPVSYEINVKSANKEYAR